MANSTGLHLGEMDDVIRRTVQSLLACEVKGRNRVHQPSIFKVPSAFRDSNPSSYNPKVVSIGPFHREAKSVQAMETRKATYLHNLLDLLELPHEETLITCVEKVTASIDKIKGSYDEMESYNDVELAQMMVMDGFFILDFVYNFDQYYLEALLAQPIAHDLMLIENQIPFFVLQDLFECTILKCKPNVSLITLIVGVVENDNFFVEELREDNLHSGTAPDHILGLLHKCYQPEINIRSKFSYSASGFHSAVELDRAGVTFKPSQDQNWPLAIKVESSRFGCFSWLWGKPTLRMPAMKITPPTESIIRNLIVYEQCSSLARHYITSYAGAIDDLVDTKEDIALLVESGVVNNYLGSNEEAANMINSVSKDIPPTQYYYIEQWEKLDKYYSSYWPRNIARLRRTYFSNPWSIIALLAGIVLFALTIVQTIFTIKAA